MFMQSITWKFVRRISMKKLVKRIFHFLGYDIIKRKGISEDHKSVRSKSLTLYTTATGRYYLPTDAHQDTVANTIKDNLIFDAEIVQVAKKYIKENTAIVDIGANFGQMSILFSEMVGNFGKVYSFEADDFIFDILKKNIQINSK